MENLTPFIGILALVFIMYRELQVRKVKSDIMPTTPLILLVVGGCIFKKYMNFQLFPSTFLCFAILAVGIAAALRAYTVKLWNESNAFY